MDYWKMAFACQLGSLRRVNKLFEEAKTTHEDIDILWNGYKLLTSALKAPATFQLLISYYETHTLKLKSDDTESDASYQDWLKSDEYLHARERLVEALRYIVALEGNSLSSEVKTICNSYLEDSSDKDTITDFEDNGLDIGEDAGEDVSSGPARSHADSTEEHNDGSHTSEPIVDDLHQYLVSLTGVESY